MSWDALLGQPSLAPSRGSSGHALLICLALGYFFVAWSTEIVASASGVVHPVYCLTREDVALHAGRRQLGSLQWHQATSIEVSFRGDKGDQVHQTSVIVRTRDDPRGAPYGV